MTLRTITRESPRAAKARAKTGKVMRRRAAKVMAISTDIVVTAVNGDIDKQIAGVTLNMVVQDDQ